MTVLRVTDLNPKDKCVLIREDLSMPVKNDQARNDARIRAALSTLRLTLEKGAVVMVCSHLGHPTEDEFFAENSLKPVVERPSKILGRGVPLLADYLNGIKAKADGLILFGNVRFNKGEKKNTDKLTQEYAALCGVLVMDAFGTIHHTERSTHDVARFVKVTTVGPLLVAKLDTLGKALDNPARPMVAIVTGPKVSTKLDVLNSLVGIYDQLIVGGGIASTFLAAARHKVDKSLYEADLIETAKAIAIEVKVPLPADVVVVKESAESVVVTVKVIAEAADDDMILDIGLQTATQFAELLKTPKIILWNGSVGVFEFNQLDKGTRTLANTIADNAAFSITGDGDTLAAIDKYGIAERIFCISTGGDVSPKSVRGKILPAVGIPEQRAKG